MRSRGMGRQGMGRQDLVHPATVQLRMVRDTCLQLQHLRRGDS
jgi:hypothetical protein